MSVNGIPSPVDIAVSGLRAHSMRMRVLAGNIANAHPSRTDSGEPYRRQEVVLSTSSDGAGLVTIDGIESDMTTDFKRVRQPGSPDADEEGYVKMPNVQVPVEMMQLMAASRAYQASAATLKRYQEMMDVTMELLR